MEGSSQQRTDHPYWMAGLTATRKACSSDAAPICTVAASIRRDGVRVCLFPSSSFVPEAGGVTSFRGVADADEIFPARQNRKRSSPRTGNRVCRTIDRCSAVALVRVNRHHRQHHSYPAPRPWVRSPSRRPSPPQEAIPPFCCFRHQEFLYFAFLLSPDAQVRSRSDGHTYTHTHTHTRDAAAPSCFRHPSRWGVRKRLTMSGAEPN
jgi:hypothetical protein